MRSALLTTTFACLLAFAAPFAAKAEPCSQLVSFTASSGQILQDIGKRRSKHVGLAVMPGISCPIVDGWSIWGDIWQRFDTSGFKLNETDLESSIAKAWGPVKLELYAGYYDLPPQPFHNGVVELYADLSYGFDLGFMRVRPALRPIQMVGVGGFADLTLLRGRVKVEVPGFLRPDLTLVLEPSAVYNFTQQPGLSRVSFRPEIALTWAATPNLDFGVAGKWANAHAIVELGTTIKF